MATTLQTDQSRRLKSERQKRHYRNKKEKQKELESNLQTMTSSLASALIENEQLSFMENIFQKLLHSADQLIGELGRILGPRKERKDHSTPETSASALLPFPQITRLAEASHLPYELLVAEDEPSDEFMMELSKQPVEILAEIDKWWLSEVLKPCRKLVANPGDVTARDEVNRWAKRRKCILYTMFRERPIDLLQLASIRVLPQHEDGKLNPRLINLPRELKLSPEQHDALLVKWQAYKLKVKEAFSNASASTSKASMSLTVSFFFTDVDEKEIRNEHRIFY
jgi:hypothetical protein